MSSEDFLHMSAEELVEQAVRGWNKVSDAIAVLLRNRTRLQDIHGLLIDFAERHLASPRNTTKKKRSRSVGARLFLSIGEEVRAVPELPFSRWGILCTRQM